MIILTLLISAACAITSGFLKAVGEEVPSLKSWAKIVSDEISLLLPRNCLPSFPDWNFDAYICIYVNIYIYLYYILFTYICFTWKHLTRPQRCICRIPRFALPAGIDENAHSTELILRTHRRIFFGPTKTCLRLILHLAYAVRSDQPTIKRHRASMLKSKGSTVTAQIGIPFFSISFIKQL